MGHRLKFTLWILPILGIGFGYACAYLFFHGLLETWHFIGKPDENILRIIGIHESRKLLVATATGEIVSFGFYNKGEVALPPLISWEKELLGPVDPVSHLNYYGADFYTLPPLFQVKQLYKMEYLYDVEGKGEVKFALATDGNLWMWDHQIAGLTGTVFFFYPIFGFLVGSAITLFIIGVNWLKGKSRFIQRDI